MTSIDGVLQLRAVTNGRPTRAMELEDVAQQLDALAARVRAGDADIEYGFLIYRAAASQAICRVPVGNTINVVTGLGMLRWAEQQMLDPTFDV